MTHLVLHQHPRVAGEVCTLCGEPTPPAGGPQLRLADSLEAVCRSCGKAHAPSLVALLDLAHAAERVGRIGRHTVCPPLTALLELARAAENFALAATPRRRKQTA